MSKKSVLLIMLIISLLAINDSAKAQMKKNKFGKII